MNFVAEREANRTKFTPVNFVHVSDTHLGASNFKLREREKDFFDAFSQVIDYCLKEKPGFVVHSGDLFDKGKPGNHVLLFVITELLRLKKAGIPLFIIPGSHDMSVDGTFITILESVGLLTNVGKPENFIKDGDSFIMKGAVMPGAVIYGVPGVRANIPKVYESLVPDDSPGFRIFLFHHITSNVIGTEDFSDIPLSLLPRGMDYYAGGHWHESEFFSYDDKPLVYAGSTEYHNIDSMEKGSPRGFIHYNGKPVFIKLNNRAVVTKRVDCSGLNPDECVSKCISNLIDSNNGLLVLSLFGRLGKGKRSEVNTELIRDACKSKGFIHANVRVSDLVNPEEELISVKGRTIEAIEDEFLRGKGYSADELLIAKQLINELGVGLSNDELNKVVDRMVLIDDN